jgi:hypothetical protein
VTKNSHLGLLLFNTLACAGQWAAQASLPLRPSWVLAISIRLADRFSNGVATLALKVDNNNRIAYYRAAIGLPPPVAENQRL